MNNILIVGGAGYIGSQMVYTSLDAGKNVIVLDNLSTGNIQTLEKAKNQIKFYEGNLLDDKILEKVFKENKIDAVIHFAANPAIVSQKPEDVPNYFESNLTGTINLLKHMRKNGVKNIVFSSTAATYGEPESLPISEKNAKNPINTYGISKWMCEQIFNEYAKVGILNVFCLRYFNACGADTKGRTGEMHDPETHLIPLIIQTALGKREKIYIFGSDYETKDGTCIRDYVHTEDLANAHLKALEYLELNNEVDEGIYEYCNLGSGSGFSNLEIIEKVKEISGNDFKVELSERRPGDPAVLIADNKKARQLLNWQPQKNLDEIIETAYNWHTSIMK